MIDEYTMAKLAQERVMHPARGAEERAQRRYGARKTRARKQFRRSIAHGLGGGLAPCELIAELRTLLRAGQAV